MHLLFCHRDLAMILCDPYAVSTIAMSAIKIMQQSVNNETVPRVSNHSQNEFCCEVVATCVISEISIEIKC